MGGALDLRPASGADLALRLFAGNMVARPFRSAAMILGDTEAIPVTATATANVTLDEIFSHVAQRRPDDELLPNRLQSLGEVAETSKVRSQVFHPA
jgi:hypothetical protein